MAAITRQWVENNILQLEICWSRVHLYESYLFYGESATRIVENLLLREYHARCHFKFCPSPWARDYFTGGRLFLKPSIRHLVDVGHGKIVTVWIDPDQELLDMLR